MHVEIKFVPSHIMIHIATILVATKHIPKVREMQLKHTSGLGVLGEKYHDRFAFVTLDNTPSQK